MGLRCKFTAAALVNKEHEAQCTEYILPPLARLRKCTVCKSIPLLMRNILPQKHRFNPALTDSDQGKPAQRRSGLFDQLWFQLANLDFL